MTTTTEKPKSKSRAAKCPALARITAAYKTCGYRRFTESELVAICSDGPFSDSEDVNAAVAQVAAAEREEVA